MNNIEKMANKTKLMFRAERKLEEKGYTFDSLNETVEYIDKNKAVIKETGLLEEEIVALREIAEDCKEAEKHHTSGGFPKAKKGERVNTHLEMIEGIENMTLEEIHDLLYES